MIENCVTGIIAGETPTHYRVAVNSEGDCKGCGISNICSSKTIELEKVIVAEQFKIGQKIQLEYRKVIQTSFIVYIVPVLFFFLGIGLSKVLLQTNNELVLFLNAVIATGISFFVVHYISKQYGNSTYKINIKPVNL